MLGGYSETTTSMGAQQLCPVPPNLSIHQEGGGLGLVLWLPGPMTLGEGLNFSELQFLHSKMGLMKHT